MRHGPDIKIVGGATYEERYGAERGLEEAFYTHPSSLPLEVRQNVEVLGYPLSKKEEAGIAFANKITNEMVTQAGEKPFDIPVENIHLVPPEEYLRWTGRKRSQATTFFKQQAILANAERARMSPVVFGSLMIHEFMHLKVPMTVEVQYDPEKPDAPKRRFIRDGLAMSSSIARTEKLGHHEHFLGVQEATIAFAQMRAQKRMLELPGFAEEREWMRSERFLYHAREIAKNKRHVHPDELEEFAREEFKWISEDGTQYELFAYEGPRRVLKYVCEQVQQHYGRGRFATWENVFDEFLKAQLSRKHFRPVMELVEECFGTLSFRILGNMSPDEGSSLLHLETMRALRRERLKQTSREKGAVPQV